MLLNFNVFQDNARQTSDSQLQLQQNAKTLAEILNHDLRKIGYETDSTAFVQIDSEKIIFNADMDRNGINDVVTYFVGDSTEVTSTTNPRDRVLYRVVNNDTISGPALGLVKAKFSYLNSNFTPTTIISQIRYVKVELWVESPEPIDGEYYFTYWEMTINPRNI